MAALVLFSNSNTSVHSHLSSLLRCLCVFAVFSNHREVGGGGFGQNQYQTHVYDRSQAGLPPFTGMGLF